MSTVKNISINILLQTTPEPQAGFGMPLFLGSGAAEIAYAEIFAPDDLLSSGYLSTDEEYLAAQAFFSQSPRPEKMAVYRRAGTAATPVTITEALGNLISLGYKEWYALFIQDRDVTSIHEAGDWIEANERLFFGCSSDQSVITGRNGNREVLLVHNDAADYPEIRWAGICLPQDAGSITWAFKKPSGATESGLTNADTTTILNGNGNVLALDEGGDVISFEGKVMSGEYIDIIRFRDFVKARIAESIRALQKNNAKIPYDRRGFMMVRSQIASALKAAAEYNGGIAPVVTDEDLTYADNDKWMYYVTVPNSPDDVPSADRANRIIPIEFGYRNSGAIHHYDITGIASV